MRRSGMNMEAIKVNNRSSILRLINSEGPISKKDIAERLFLTPAAVTIICSEFMQSGLLVECGIQEEETARAGRKKILVDINREYCYIYGINIDPENTVIALCNLRGDVLAMEKMKTPQGEMPEVFFDLIAEKCCYLQEKTNIKKEKLGGAGVGIVGLVDKKTGRSIQAYGIWNESVPVGGLLQERLGIPVAVENNVDAFALAEILFGAGKRADDMLLVKWGPGVGASIVIDNRIYKGRLGASAELGHYIVDKDGALCSCGRKGCLQTIISRRALSRKIPEFPECAGMPPDSAHVLDEAIDLFARAIVNAAAILAPEYVVLYGSLFRESLLRDQLIAACSRYDSSCGTNRILYSTLAVKEEYIGPVAHFVMENIFNS